MHTKHKLIRSPTLCSGLMLGCLLLIDQSVHAAWADLPAASETARGLASSAVPISQSSPLPPPQSANSSAFTRGMDAYRKGDFDTARKLLAEAAVAEPTNGDCQAVLGYLLAQAGQFDEALPYLEKALTERTISISPTNSRLNLGKALLMRPGHTDADAERAVALFEEAATLSPRVEDVQLALGYGYTRADHYDKAVAAYRAATDIAPTDATAWKNLGLTLRKAGSPGDAIIALKKSSELNAADAEVWANLGDTCLDRADAPAALTAFEAGHKAAPDNVPIMVRIGNLNLRLLHYSEAGDAYGAAADRLEADPTAAVGISAASLRYDQGAALAHTPRLDDAEAAYEKAIALDPNYFDALLNSGFLMYNQGKFDAAIGRFKKITQIKPGSDVAWRNLAAAADRNHDSEIAVAAWRRAVALKPTDYDSCDRLADAIQQQSPTSDEAVKQYLAMQHLRPRASEASINLGLLYQRQAEAASLASTKQAKLVLAMNSFLDAIRRDPRSAIAYNNLGVVHERRGEIPEAVAAYTKAIALDPHLSDARSNLARFHLVSTPGAGRPR